MIVGILGFRGTGKDTVAHILEQTELTQKIGFADPLKRLCMNLFDFSYEQLWGTQAQKEAPDERYPREHTWAEDYVHLPEKTLNDPSGASKKCKCCGYLRPLWRQVEPVQCYLTPRYAMQIMGTEGGRHCWHDIWVHKALTDALLIQHGHRYDQTTGTSRISIGYKPNAVFIDNRFINEVEAIWKSGGMVFRIKRPGFEKPAYDHQSETEQLQIPDDKLQGVIQNDGTLEDLRFKVIQLIGKHLQE